MGVSHHHHHHHHHRLRRHFKNNNNSLILLTLASFTFLLFCTSASSIPAPVKNSGRVVEEGKSLHIGGPGSTPPTCRSKCGKCNPCKPVHVPIHPGLTVPLEYYPEAWRCLCRNKLFMP